MKRVLFLISGFGSGGAEHQCSQLINMLIEKGYIITCVSFDDTEDHYYLSPKVNRVRIAPNQSLLKKIIAIEHFLLIAPIDVVVAFSQRMSCLSLFPLLIRPRVKVISSERNFTIEKADRFEKILIRTGIYRRATFIVPNNYSQGRYLAKKMPSIKNKIHVITNYTDVFTYSRTPAPNNAIVRIGVFCRFERQKNFHRLLEAMYVLNQRYDFKYHIDWYGNHKFSTIEQNLYFDQGLSMIRDLDLRDYITIHEPTKDVARLIPTFDVLCLPSLHEGFSNSISEYICCGRPVLCSDVSDNAVMVHEGENGFLFDPLNIEEIVSSFARFLGLPKEQMVIMGKKSREIAEGLFDKESFVNEYISLIEA